MHAHPGEVLPPHPVGDAGPVRPPLEIADVFAAVGLEAYGARHRLNPRQHKAFRDILTCRTSALGGHLSTCAACGHEVPRYNSCCNRSCPRCQGLAQHRWIEARKARVLPCRYFHAVFTVPAELRPLALSDPRCFYNLLFKAASATLLKLGEDPRYLGAQLGITAVLHTWSRDLSLHPHVHCIVTAGGLSTDQWRWLPSGKAFLFPLNVVRKRFRGLLLTRLRACFASGELEVPAQLRKPGAFERLIKSLWHKDFKPFIKPPFEGAEQLYAYLGRYTHRIAISRSRLLSFDGATVTFRTRGDHQATLSADEFTRRFLMHVLPRGFIKIRHYGLFASPNVNTRLEVARALLPPAPEPVSEEKSATEMDRSQTPIEGAQQEVGVEEPAWLKELWELTGLDLAQCPRCGLRAMVPVMLPRATGPPDGKHTPQTEAP